MSGKKIGYYLLQLVGIAIELFGIGLGLFVSIYIMIVKPISNFIDTFNATGLIDKALVWKGLLKICLGAPLSIVVIFVPLFCIGAAIYDKAKAKLDAAKEAEHQQYHHDHNVNVMPDGIPFIDPGSETPSHDSTLGVMLMNDKIKKEKEATKGGEK